VRFGAGINDTGDSTKRRWSLSLIADNELRFGVVNFHLITHSLDFGIVFF
jgi:hypothetical protein